MLDARGTGLRRDRALGSVLPANAHPQRLGTQHLLDRPGPLGLADPLALDHKSIALLHVHRSPSFRLGNQRRIPRWALRLPPLADTLRPELGCADLVTLLLGRDQAADRSRPEARRVPPPAWAIRSSSRST